MSEVTTARPAPEPDTLHPATSESRERRRALVIGSRTALVMLLIAAVALAALGIAVLVLGHPAEVSGWLRSVFGSVFGTIAIAMAGVLGIPAAIGVWAMSGATAEDARPAMSRTVRRVLAAIAVAALVMAGVGVLTLGDRLTILDVAVVGLAALPTLGLAGAVAHSPHRGRSWLAAAALLLVSAGIAWMATRVATLPLGPPLP